MQANTVHALGFDLLLYDLEWVTNLCYSVLQNYVYVVY